MQEMQAKASREKFGSLVQVSESQYKEEVNNAGPGVWVVVCLFQPGIPACSLLLQRLESLARKFRATKFVKIVATDAIHNYPDRNCPTLLLYFEGDMKRQMVGLTNLAGLNTTEAGGVPSRAPWPPLVGAADDASGGMAEPVTGVRSCQMWSGSSRRSAPLTARWRKRRARVCPSATRWPWPRV